MNSERLADDARQHCHTLNSKTNHNKAEESCYEIVFGKFISIITYFQWRWLSQVVVQQGYSWSTHTELTNMLILWI